MYSRLTFVSNNFYILNLQTMKALLKIRNIALALFILTPMLSFAQNEKVGVDKDFTFDENSKTETFTFEVKKGTKKININFEGTISKGGLKVKITDPDGNKISGFSLKTSRSGTRTLSYSYSSDSDDKTRAEDSERAGSSSSSSKSANASSSSRSSASASSSSSSRSRASSRTSVRADVNNPDSLIINNSKTNEYIYTNNKTENDKAGARGVINKEITNPTVGVWKFTIYPNDTEGQLVAKITYK
jgi:hypothetical protein